MKKITKVAALLAASALLFGGLFLSCSDSDDDNNNDSGNTEKTQSDTVPEKADDTAGDDNGGSGNFTYTFAGKKSFGSLNMDDASAQTLTADAVLNSSDDIKVTLLSMSNEAFGTNEIAANTESNGVTLTAKYKLKNDPSYKTNQNDVGLVVKNTSIKVTGATGKVKVVVVWSIAGKKSGNDRGVFVKVGETIKGSGNADTSSAEKPTDIKNTVEAEGTGDIYIAASNESVIESIKITSAE